MVYEAMVDVERGHEFPCGGDGGGRLDGEGAAQEGETGRERLLALLARGRRLAPESVQEDERDGAKTFLYVRIHHMSSKHKKAKESVHEYI